MAAAPSCFPSCRTSTWAPWLRAALADIEQRVQEVALSAAAAAEQPDSFAERAENYYQKRPQLIALLHDLHNRYLHLADRYSKALHHRRLSSSASDDAEYATTESSVSDAESSLSFQPPPPSPGGNGAAFDLVVAELVMAAVDREMLLDEMGEAERRGAETARKVELQRSLVEVLESERLVLIGENARLAYRAAAAEEEAAAMAVGAGYMRRRAAELEGVVANLRGDHRVCLLGRKIDGLQAQIYGLERRNRECYEGMVRREAEKGEARAELERLRAENRRLKEEGMRRRRRWWDRIRKAEWALCGPHFEPRKGCFM